MKGVIDIMNHYDVFLSHASSDKLPFVNELKESFENLGIDVFYDKDVIIWGDNWKETILKGLENCDYGVVVISERFFGREWTEQELKQLFSRQKESGHKIVLPILYNTTSEELHKNYPELSEIQFLDSSKHDIKDITIQLARVMLSNRKIMGEIDKEKTRVKQILDKAFKEMNSLDFFEWFSKLVESGKEFIDGYDSFFIGWDHPFREIFQHKNKGHTSVIMYRINPIYYEETAAYFEKYIKPQI